MHFIPDAGVSRIGQLLRKVRCGDRIVRGRCELVDIDKPISNNELQRMLQASPSLGPYSGADALADPAQRDLFYALTNVLELVFPDDDVRTVLPSAFRLRDVREVEQEILLALDVLESRVPHFFTDLWTTIREAVQLSACEVVELSAVHARHGGVGAFFYFFVDRRQKRVLFLHAQHHPMYGAQPSECGTASGAGSDGSRMDSDNASGADNNGSDDDSEEEREYYQMDDDEDDDEF